MLLACASLSVFCCSAVSCLGDGPEFSHDFTVDVRFAGKPLPGVRVRITGPVSVETVTASNGKVKFSIPTSGTYWVTADYLGTEVASQCFHTLKRPTRRAKHIVKYHWGDQAPVTTRVSGKILDLHSGHGGDPVWNLTHPTKVPVVAAELMLKNARTNETLKTTSGVSGDFVFGTLPKGIYVLQVQGGIAPHQLEPSSFAIAVDPTARYSYLTITRSEATGGSCGGVGLSLEAAP